MNDEIELIKEKLDLAELVGEYVQLKQAGQHFKGLCPFHNEKTPSFVVSPERGIWHCFGCGAGGDAFSFLQKIEGIEFKEALKTLADRTGVELKTQRQSGQSNQKMGLHDMLALAARFFHEVLMRHPAGEQARKYLEERGVRPETMEEFQIGYAVKSWEGIQTFLRRKGFSNAQMLAAGLAGRSQQGKLYDRFRGRIMFPVHDVQGRVVAFGGRITPWHATGEEGKYVNSPETQIYEKRRVVYNLNRAKREVRAGSPILVVEGYMDVVMLQQAGVKNVVASSGTAFTQEQIALLKRYTQTLHFAFDGDAAGVHAAQAATAAAVAAGMRVATVLFPGGQDPADVALNEPEKLKEYLAQPTPLIEVLLKRMQAADNQDRENLLREVLPFVRQVENMVQQGEMVQMIANMLHVPEGIILERLAAIPRRMMVTAQSVVGENGVVTDRSEQVLMGLVVGWPEARAAVWGELDENLWQDSGIKKVYQALQQAGDLSGLNAAEVIQIVPAEMVSLVEGLRMLAEEHMEHGQMKVKEAAEVITRRIKRNYWQGKRRDLKLEIDKAEEGARADLLQKFQEATQKLAAIKD